MTMTRREKTIKEEKENNPRKQTKRVKQERKNSIKENARIEIGIGIKEQKQE